MRYALVTGAREEVAADPKVVRRMKQELSRRPRRTPVRETRWAWAIAIDSGTPGCPALAGIFMYQSEYPSPWQNGMRIALFPTRKAARAFAKQTWPGYHPRPIRVEVTIEEERRR